MKTAIGVGLVVAVVACSGAGGPCQKRAGTYKATYTQRSGDCGPVSEQITKVDAQPTRVDPPCSGSIGYSADNCVVEYTMTCPISGGTARITGKSTWSADGRSGTATEQWAASVTGSACSSAYDVSIVKL